MHHSQFTRSQTPRIARPLLLSAVVLLGVVIGVAKIVETPHLVAHFGAVGFAPEALSLYGALQLLCALLMIPHRTRLAAGFILAASFGFSALLIADLGEWGLVAIPSIALALTLIALFWRKSTLPG